MGQKMKSELCEERELCERAFERKIAEKEKQIAERIKVISMRYELKMESAAKRSDEKMNIERAQFAMSQELLQKEIESLNENFKKEIQILKRFKPHHIVHVPLNVNAHDGADGKSYGSKLLQYI